MSIDLLGRNGRVQSIAIRNFEDGRRSRSAVIEAAEKAAEKARDGWRTRYDGSSVMEPLTLKRVWR